MHIEQKPTRCVGDVTSAAQDLQIKIYFRVCVIGGLGWFALSAAHTTPSSARSRDEAFDQAEDGKRELATAATVIVWNRNSGRSQVPIRPSSYFQAMRSRA